MIPFESIDPRTSVWIVQSLAHIIWQGAVFAAFAMVVARGLQNRSAQSRYLVHCSALFLTAACLPLNLWICVPTELSAGGFAVPASVLGGTDNSRHPDDTVVATQVPLEANLSDQETLVSVFVPLSVRAVARSGWLVASHWIVVVYLLGTVAMLTRLVLGLYGGQRLRATAMPITDTTVQNILTRARQHVRLHVMPLVAHSARVTTPLVVGVIRPAILLPAAILNNLTPEQVESLLLHELAHIRRYDHVVNLLQRIAETVLFFHPAVWWLSHKVSVEREHCCDDLAIAWGSDPCDYAESLVRVSELRFQAAGLGAESAAVLAATGGRPTRLRGRVLRILGMPTSGPNVGLTRYGVAVLIALVVSAAAIVKSEAGAGPSDEQIPVEDRATHTRHFVRVVVGDEKVSLQGETITWDQLKERLQQVSDREHTVLEYATTPGGGGRDTEIYKLAVELGFEYFSRVGVHPLTSIGLPDQEVDFDTEQDAEQKAQLARFIQQILRQLENDRVQIATVPDRQTLINGVVMSDEHALGVLRAIPNRQLKVLEITLQPEPSPESANAFPGVIGAYVRAYSTEKVRREHWKITAGALGFRGVRFITSDDQDQASDEMDGRGQGETDEDDKNADVSRGVVEQWLALIENKMLGEAARLMGRGKNENADDALSMTLLLEAAAEGNITILDAHAHRNAALVVTKPLEDGPHAGKAFIFHLGRNIRFGREWRIHEVSLVAPEEIAVQLEAFHDKPANNPIDRRGFGPIVERTLRRTSTHTTALNLDTNRLVHVPNDLETNREVMPDPLKWIAVRGIDVMPQSSPNRRDELRGVGGLFRKISQVEDEFWDESDATRVCATLDTGQQEKPVIHWRHTEGPYPVTYVFETLPYPTGDSQQGILQVLAVDPKERTVELQYKLVGDSDKAGR